MSGYDEIKKYQVGSRRHLHLPFARSFVVFAFLDFCSANIRTLALSIDLLRHRCTAAQIKNRTFPSPPLAKQDHLYIASVSESTQLVNMKRENVGFQDCVWFTGVR